MDFPFTESARAKRKSRKGSMPLNVETVMKQDRVEKGEAKLSSLQFRAFAQAVKNKLAALTPEEQEAAYKQMEWALYDVERPGAEKALREHFTARSQKPLPSEAETRKGTRAFRATVGSVLGAPAGALVGGVLGSGAALAARKPSLALQGAIGGAGLGIPVGALIGGLRKVTPEDIAQSQQWARDDRALASKMLRHPGEQRRLIEEWYSGGPEELLEAPTKVAFGMYNPTPLAPMAGTTSAAGIQRAPVVSLDEAMEASKQIQKAKGPRKQLEAGAVGAAAAPFINVAKGVTKGFMDTKGGLRARLGGAAAEVGKTTMGEVGSQMVGGGLTGVALSAGREGLRVREARKKLRAYLNQQYGQ